RSRNRTVRTNWNTGSKSSASFQVHSASLSVHSLGHRLSNLAFGEHGAAPFVFSERGQLHLGFAGIGAMHSLAVVAKCLLREALGITCLLGTFRPSITVAVQRNTDDFETNAPPLEFLRTVFFVRQPQSW